MTDQPELQPPAAAPVYAGPPSTAGMSAWGPLATWAPRVGASLIDALVAAIGLVPYLVGAFLVVVGAPDSTNTTASGSTTTSGGNPALIVTGAALALVGLLLLIGIQLWNRTFRQGRTGQSLGKRVMGLKLVEERSGQPVGAGMAFVRELAHTVDGFFYIGYLWPLWDDKRQTFADKILDTVVIVVPKG